MLFGRNRDGIMIRSEPKRIAVCPSCGEMLIPKCGNINIWHWAHKSGNDCDPWSEPETEWHRSWKAQFPIECCEQTIEIGASRHRGDIVIPGKRIIELQHSFISAEEITEREKFYGKELVWIFDVSDCFERFEPLSYRGSKYYRWKHARKHVYFTKRKFLDFGKGDLFWVSCMGYDGHPIWLYGKWYSKEYVIQHYLNMLYLIK